MVVGGMKVTATRYWPRLPYAGYGVTGLPVPLTHTKSVPAADTGTLASAAEVVLVLLASAMVVFRASVRRTSGVCVCLPAVTSTAWEHTAEKAPPNTCPRVSRLANVWEGYLVE